MQNPFPGNLKNEGRIFFPTASNNVIMSIQDELSVISIPTFDAEPAFADRHRILFWAGIGDLTEVDPCRAAYPPVVGCYT